MTELLCCGKKLTRHCKSTVLQPFFFFLEMGNMRFSLSRVGRNKDGSKEAMPELSFSISVKDSQHDVGKDGISIIHQASA